MSKTLFVAVADVRELRKVRIPHEPDGLWYRKCICLRCDRYPCIYGCDEFVITMCDLFKKKENGK